MFSNQRAPDSKQVIIEGFTFALRKNKTGITTLARGRKRKREERLYELTWTPSKR